MKRVLLICLLFITSSVAAIAQNTPPTEVPKTTFVAKYTSMYNHLVANQLGLAQQEFEELKPMFIGNFAVDKYAILNAATPAIKTQLLGVQNTKQTLYSEFMGLASDMIANKNAMKSKLDDFADLY
jgi:hypothetical protein